MCLKEFADDNISEQVMPACKPSRCSNAAGMHSLQEVYTSQDVKNFLVQLQSDLMGVVDKVCTSLLQRRPLCQTNLCMHCLLGPVHASHATGLLHLLLCQPGACT